MAAACLGALSWALTAHAQAPAGRIPRDRRGGTDQQARSKAGTSGSDQPAQTPIAADRQRPVPDYDGRGDPPTTAGDVLIWVPRIALSPLYLVSEYVVRRPIGWLVTTAERKRWPALIVDFFTFGPDKNAGIIPTALIDFGFKPSVGLYFFWNGFLADKNNLRARAATWGEDWLHLAVADRVLVQPNQELSLRAEFLERPDWVFYGIGPNTRGENVSRFGSTRVDAEFGYDAQLWRSSAAHAFVGVRHVSFQSDRTCCGDPSIATQMARGLYPEPVGLADGYSVLREGVDLAFDSRRPKQSAAPKNDRDFMPPSGSGIRIDVRAEHASSITESRLLSNLPPTRYEWIRYGATLGGFIDVTGHQRVLGLSLVADFADPLLDNLHGSGLTPIPFTEQVSLGGFRPMRGYLTGRLIDRSSAVAILEYQWPVWVWLDGTLHYSIGNVFGEHLDGFAFEKLRSSFGLGLRSTSARDHPFEILVALGTRTFEQGSGIDHVRLVAGTTLGF